MVLSDEVRLLTRIVRQQQERATLRDHGQCRRAHLLSRPPGTGKTMTASALAGELHLPLFTVRLESLFSRFFGETAGKLRVLFDQSHRRGGSTSLMSSTRSALAGAIRTTWARIRRVLNSVLAFMEEPNSTDSLVVAATNHVEILDQALARRFDEVIGYGLPDLTGARGILDRRLGRFELPPRSSPRLRRVLEGLEPSRARAGG